MTITFAAADPAAARHTSQGVIARIAAAVAVRLARAKARHEYRQMLQLEDHILSDIGVTRGDVRQALSACGGRT